MKNEIGSNFWITSQQLTFIIQSSKDDEPELWGKDVTFLSTCRSAISTALRLLDNDTKKIALIPAFTCHSVLHPFLTNGYKVYPYRICEDLRIDPKTFLEDFNNINPSVILVHSFFGFDTLGNLTSLLNLLKSKGVTIIEDLTQRMFSTFEYIPSNYQVGSIRKWMPIPDGAFISTLISDSLDEDKELEQAKLKAMVAKGDFIVNNFGEKTVFRQLLKDAEDLLDSRESSYRMCKISKKIFNSYDLFEFKNRRAENYRELVHRLKEFTDLVILFPNLDDKTVPFLVPVLVNKNRRELQQYLASKNIYPTVIWACPQEFSNQIDSQAKSVYESILCFHCDQRYSIADMQRIGDEIDNYYYKKR